MKKVTALIIVLACVLSLCACAQQKQGKTVDEHIELAPMDASMSYMLNFNPDRAWRGEAYVNVGNSMADGHTPQEDPTVNLRRFVTNYAAYNPQLCQVYFYLSAYKNTPEIDDYGMDRMQQVFDCARELGVKLNVRFTYQWGMGGNGEASDDIMLAHMKQLRPLLEKNIDVIHVIEAGFLGAWGEWHSSKEFHNNAAILRGILEMPPEPLFVQVRTAQKWGQFTPFGDLRVGFNCCDGGGIYLSPTVGYRLNWGRKANLNLGIGLTLRGSTTDNYRMTFTEDFLGTGQSVLDIEYIGKSHHTKAMFTIRLGIDF